jgi:hypothetical protein
VSPVPEPLPLPDGELTEPMVDGTSVNVTSHCDIAVATPLSPQAARIRTNKANRFTFFSPFLEVIEHP